MHAGRAARGSLALPPDVTLAPVNSRKPLRRAPAYLRGAQQLIAPIVTYHRGLAARNHGDQQQAFEMAVALYAQALIDARQRGALLQQAAALLDTVAAPVRALHSGQLWREKIRAAQRTPAAAPPPTLDPPRG